MSDPKTPRNAAQLIQKAMTDPAFKARLLADPKATLEAWYGRTMPAGLSVEVLQETPQKVFLVLPAAGTGEVSDKELEAMAGGLDDPETSPTSIFICGI
jgi:hypothetical protein